MKAPWLKGFTAILALTITINLSAQDYWKEFKALSKSKDSIAQVALLQKWEKENDKDPQLYVAYFNYYVNAGRQSYVQLGNNPRGNDVLQLKDSSGNVAGFMYEGLNYDIDLVNKGFGYIDKGIKLFPNRLDMRFGKVYVYGELEDWEAFTKEIIETINYGASINYKWLWTDGVPSKDGKEQMLDAIQSYVMQLYNTEDDKLLDNMRRVAETVLKYEPNHVESLSNVAITYILTDKPDKALEYLFKAEKINPKDAIVLNNIATIYRNKGDKDNAIKYYQLTIKHGNEDEKAFAESQITKLKAKK